MDEKNVDPLIFTWTVKIGTAIITFMTGIIVYLHRKVHAMDKVLAVNQERYKNSEKILIGIQTTVNNIKSDQEVAIKLFHEHQTMYNETEGQRKELSVVIKDQAEIIEDLRKLRKFK